MLTSLSHRCLNDKGKRILFLTSVYASMTMAYGKPLDLHALNRALHLACHIDGLKLAVLIHPLIWPRKFRCWVRRTSVSRAMVFVARAIPPCLDYRLSTNYSFNEDIKRLAQFFS